MRRPARETIRLGFMPLTDAAIPVVAARRGFADQQGLAIELVRETSWANVRDRLAIGHFDAAHLLAPLPIAAALGLQPFDVPLVAPMALALGGNAITVSESIWNALCAAQPSLRVNDPASMGAAMAGLVADRRRRGLPRIVLAVVHPSSSHNFELRYWLAAAGLDPERDLGIAILPPHYLPDALAAGRIDGYCVGEPWNSRAALAGTGRIVLTKQAIWPNSPDKVLALRADWAQSREDVVTRLVSAMLMSSAWCADRANHAALAKLLAAPDVLDAPVAEIRPALDCRMTLADGDCSVPGMIQFAPGGLAPSLRHGAFLLSQMRRWQQARLAGRRAEARAFRLLGGVFDPARYDRAAASLGLPPAPIEPPLDSMPDAERFPGLFDSLAAQ